MIVQYIRNSKGVPRGCVVAVDRDRVGVSLCSPEDHFRKEIARGLAAGRALAGGRDAIPELISGDLKTAVEETVATVRDRSIRYFKRVGDNHVGIY